MANARILRVKNPSNNQDLEIRFEHGYLDYLYKYQPVRFQNIRTAVNVLNRPKRIFIGIKRAVSQDGLCFVGKPDRWYVRENVIVDFPKDELVYTVYLNDRNSVYDFRAEEIDVEDEDSPEDWKNRFGGVLWKKTS